MKGIRVIAVTFLASCTVIAANDPCEDQEFSYHNVSRFPIWQPDNIPTVCPFPEEPWKKATNLPHENDCTRFYKCVFGRPVLQFCPPYQYYPLKRLHYNRAKQVCDWPLRAGCESCPTTITIRGDGYNKRSISGYPYPRMPSMISHERDDCNCYWECPVFGQPRLRHCQPGLCFSRTCQRCVANRKGGYCDRRPDWNGGCKEDERKEHDCYCTKFYICKNGEFFVEECEENLHFDPRSQRCRMPRDANCRHRRASKDE
ncbi:hypothetical protein HN011_000057 [Eciton burchellii]|nr:hypothetical protein HN011_000057 [Eciton burchellii]